MATERLPMRKTREILRLRWAVGLSVRETARSLGVSTGAVSQTTSRASSAGLRWADAEALSEEVLEKRLYGPRLPQGHARPEPDPVWMDTELRQPGVTLELLHLEYLEQHPDGLRYTAFAERYRRWKRKQQVVLRQVHKAGEKIFVDYSGKRPWVVDRAMGERRAVELFVAVLGASNYTYVEATETQRSADFVGSCTRMLAYFGGVPGAVVPDQLKSAVSESSRYEPGIQQTFAEWARHHGTAVVPARPYKPRDKGKVEAGVLVAQRWILARLRHQTFFSLAELNARIAELLVELNARPMRHRKGVSRRDLYERLDRPALKPLPERPYEPASWGTGRVHWDYHVSIQKHWYSVPHPLVGEDVDYRVTASTVEIFLRGRRVASHARSDDPFESTTDPAHRPPNHQVWVEQDPGRLVSWAAEVGPSTETMMRRLLVRSHNIHPETRWRSAFGIRRLGDKYGHERCEQACLRALHFGSASYRVVKQILKHNLDQRPLPNEVPEDDAPIEHEQVRGPGYYQ
jgi:transposase